MRIAFMLLVVVHFSTSSVLAGEAAKKPRRDFNGDPLPERVVARLGTLRFQPPGYESGHDDLERRARRLFQPQAPPSLAPEIGVRM